MGSAVGNRGYSDNWQVDKPDQPHRLFSSYTALSESAIGNPYLFTGRRYDPESGNYYYRARIYSRGLAPVGIAFITGFLPGGKLLRSAVAAAGFVILNYFDALALCQEYTPAQALRDFAIGVGIELIGEKAGELVARYGVQAVRAGFNKLGLSDAFERALRKLDTPGNPRPNPCRRNSFSAETTVVTDDGDQPISTLVIGDVVLAYDETTGELGYFAVIDTIVHEDLVVQYLTIDGETITTTPNHPFYTHDGQWVNAGRLQPGHQIRRADGSYGTVETSTFAYAPQPVYNLTIATAHTYFVGDGQWLVHNTNPCINLPKWRRGEPTRGVLEASDGLTPLVSGKSGGPQMPPETPGFNPGLSSTVHVESHAAAHMRQNGLGEATLYINKTPCSGVYGCQQLLSTRLPEGARLHIYVGHGSDYNFFDTFVGLPD